MSVQVFLNRPHPFFTNLDYISGKAVLSLSTETAISSINVKLEGESRTRLAAAKYPHNERSDKKRTEIELHKVRTNIKISQIRELMLTRGHVSFDIGAV